MKDEALRHCIKMKAARLAMERCVMRGVTDRIEPNVLNYIEFRLKGNR